MKNCIYKKFDKIYQGYLLYKEDSSELTDIRMWRHSGKMFRNRASFLTFNAQSEYGVLKSLIARHKWRDVAKRLYICPECSIPRDLLRNSGYSITLSRNSADAVVVPDFWENTARLYFNVAAEQNGSLFLFTIARKYDYYSKGIPENITFDTVKTFLAERGFSILGDCIGKDMTCDVVPHVNIYNDLIADPHLWLKCVTESNVERKPTIVICPDTLNIWLHMTDYAMMEQSIIGSDWGEYPTTLCLMLFLKTGIYNAKTEKFRNLLRQIGYIETSSVMGLVKGRIIQPKDWNMMQDFMAMRLGIDSSGGYLPLSSMRKLDVFQYLLRTAIAVKPKHIDRPMTFENIFPQQIT